jgi:two-component system, OmpR family, sensor histidine kinase BaeS
VETASAIGRGPGTNMDRAMPTRAHPSRAFRLSLVNQLVLLLVAAVLLAVTVLGGAVAWNLRAGFSDYLRQQDEDWLNRFVEVASEAVSQQGLDAVSGGMGRLRPLFEAVAPSDGSAPRPPRGEAGPGAGPDRGPGLRPDRPPPGPPGAPPPAARRLSQRVSIVDLQGQPLSGRALQPHEVAARRDIVVKGLPVATVLLFRAPPATQEVDAAFLARQYQGILGTAALLLLLAVVGAVWVGRRWLRPIQQAQQAARQIAEGALDVRLAPRGNDELADLAHDINAMAASLQQLEASRRRWLAELSHEMRTPLAVLRGEVEALVDGVRPVTPTALASLQEEVARVTRLVEDFHQLALSDLRALPCNFSALQPQPLLQRALDRVAVRAQASGLRLSLQTDADAAVATAHWDPQRMEQLLSNLLENSLRYTDAPGQVQVQLALAGAQQLQICVQDSAPGVPEADLPRLFEPLYRADPSRSRRSGGSGLGLAICLAIVRSHGGQLLAQRSPLGGLRLVATLPLHPAGAV